VREIEETADRPFENHGDQSSNNGTDSGVGSPQYYISLYALYGSSVFGTVIEDFQEEKFDNYRH